MQFGPIRRVSDPEPFPKLEYGSTLRRLTEPESEERGTRPKMTSNVYE